MNYTAVVEELHELARQLGVQLRYEKGDFEGGYCILKEQKLLVINKRLPDVRKASSIAQGLFEYGLETTFVKPSLREYIEEEVAKGRRKTKQAAG
jgi:hypothetical protein